MIYGFVIVLLFGVFIGIYLFVYVVLVVVIVMGVSKEDLILEVIEKEGVDFDFMF